jgi:DNA-binding GntR family transcriptional regulator
MVETVYGEVHKAIVDRRLRPGTKLREVSLGELFGVSRTTVRAALQRLEADGLVTIEPNKGASVSLPSANEIGELFSLRRIVETGIVAHLCQHRQATLINSLRKHIRNEQKALAAGDYRKAIALMGAFHELLAEATGNKILTDFFKGTVQRTSLVVTTFDDTSHGGCRSDEHTILLDRIEAGDITGAIACMDEHLREIEDAITSQAERVASDYHPLQHLFEHLSPTEPKS